MQAAQLTRNHLLRTAANSCRMLIHDVSDLAVALVATVISSPGLDVIAVTDVGVGTHNGRSARRYAYC